MTDEKVSTALVTFLFVVTPFLFFVGGLALGLTFVAVPNDAQVILWIMSATCIIIGLIAQFVVVRILRSLIPEKMSTSASSGPQAEASPRDPNVAVFIVEFPNHAVQR